MTSFAGSPRAYMRRERPGQTLQATALVHEAYLRLAGGGAAWTDHKHFIGIAARSMRQILVERARARGAQKRWAGMNRVTLTESLAGAAAEDAMLPALDEALVRLEQLDPEQARIVELRYFVGLGIDETAADSWNLSRDPQASMGARARMVVSRAELRVAVHVDD